MRKGKSCGSKRTARVGGVQNDERTFERREVKCDSASGWTTTGSAHKAECSTRSSRLRATAHRKEHQRRVAVGAREPRRLTGGELVSVTRRRDSTRDTTNLPITHNTNTIHYTHSTATTQRSLETHRKEARCARGPSASRQGRRETEQRGIRQDGRPHERERGAL